MKTSVLLVAMALATSLATAQQDTVPAVQTKQSNVSLEAQAGYSMAFGEYIATGRDDKQAGFASNGFWVQFSGNWLGKSGVGLAVSYCYQNNPIAKNYADSILVDMQDPLGPGNWNNHYLLAGPVFSRHIGDWFVTARVQGGGILAFSPVFQIPLPSTDSLNPFASTVSKGPGFGIAFQAMAGAGYRISDNLTVNLAFSFLGGNPNRSKSYYQYILEKDPGTGEEHLVYIQGDKERKKKVSAFNIGVGIVYKL